MLIITIWSIPDALHNTWIVEEILRMLTGRKVTLAKETTLLIDVQNMFRISIIQTLQRESQNVLQIPGDAVTCEIACHAYNLQFVSQHKLLLIY